MELYYNFIKFADDFTYYREEIMEANYRELQNLFL
jgi:hypothetical protein